jgi:hypothetical protein
MTQRPALLRVLLSACLLWGVPAVPLYAQLEGTLFTSPEQRAYMDFLRAEFLANSRETGFNILVPEIPEVPGEVTAAEGPPAPLEFSFGGIMTSRDGSRSVWLNHQLLQESDLPDWVRIVSAPPGLALQLDTNGSRWLLKPGQTVDITAGSIVEEYQRPAPVPAVASAGDNLASMATAVIAESTAAVIDAVDSTATAATEPAPPAPETFSDEDLPDDPATLDAMIDRLQLRRAELDD